jgi:hypothetical protein
VLVGTFEDQRVGRHALLGELALHKRAGGARAEPRRLEQQPAARAGEQDAGKRLHHPRHELVNRRHAAEGQLAAACQRRRRSDLGHRVADLEAQVAERHVHQRLFELGRFAGRRDDGVGDDGVVSVEPRGGEAVEPAHHAPRRTGGDHGQPVGQAVAVQVDEQVEVECGNALGGLRVGEPGQATKPSCGCCA